jgi:putative transposase
VPAGWPSCSLIARRLSGVQLVISDAHMGLVNAIGAPLPGASWQRCRTLPHGLNGRGGTPIARALLSQVPKSAQLWVATLLRTIFEQPDTDAVQAQMRHVLDALEAKFPKADAHLPYTASPTVEALGSRWIPGPGATEAAAWAQTTGSCTAPALA